MKMEKVLRILFVFYLLLLVKVIVFKYPWAQLRQIAEGWTKEVVWEGLRSANFVFLKTIKMYIRYADRLNSFENLVGNVAALVPFGFLVPLISHRGRNLLILLVHAFFFVTGIEIFQLLSAFGVFDVDDILLNCLGALIGWLLFFTLTDKKTDPD